LPKLPVVNGREVILALKRAGFVVDSREGSHVTLVHPGCGRRTTVPTHGGRDVKPGTLRNITAQAGLTVEEFTDLLR
jgi:predicted RNA binding protein YcfA (HicA-like mRNA interferase family)